MAENSILKMSEVVKTVLVQDVITKGNSSLTFIKWTVGSSSSKGTTECLNSVL